MPGCKCEVCKSTDKKNYRLRCSVFIEIQNKDVAQNLTQNPNEVIASVLIDTATDLRHQALKFGIDKIDAVLYTHIHADHIYGIDELRSFNFINDCSIPIYASETSSNELEVKFNYAFNSNPNYEGASPPKLTLQRINALQPFNLFGLDFLPLPVLHGKMEVFGFRVKNFAYITDCSYIPESTREQLLGLDILIIDGLRNRPHRTHFTHSQAVSEIEKISPKKSYLTHLSHEIDHDRGNLALKDLTQLDVELAYDGLLFEL